MQKKKIHWGLVLLVLFCAILVLLVVWHFWQNLYPDLGKVFAPTKEEKIAAYIEAQGTWKGYACVFLLSVIQVVSVFLSGSLIQIAAGLVYVWWKAFLLCYSGFLLANIGVFLFARHSKHNLSDVPALKRATDKIRSDDPVFAVALANLLPGIPNGACPYMAADSGLSLGQFTLAVTTTSWIQILLNCLVGHLLIRGEYIWSILAYLLELAISGTVYLIQKKKQKNA